MKLVVGLGNPGEKYKDTKHNVGFMVLDGFAKEHGLDFKLDKNFNAFVGSYNGKDKCILIKPTTFMNLSGEAVIKVMNYYKIELDDIIVISDDINLPVGRLRLREKGSAGGQNGLKNIILHLKGDNFKRIRVGIGLNENKDLVNHVLSNFSKDEKTLIDIAVKKSVEAIKNFIDEESYSDIMTKFNTQD